VENRHWCAGVTSGPRRLSKGPWATATYKTSTANALRAVVHRPGTIPSSPPQCSDPVPLPQKQRLPIQLGPDRVLPTKAPPRNRDRATAKMPRHRPSRATLSNAIFPAT
jgi:hypothetical protein